MLPKLIYKRCFRFITTGNNKLFKFVTALLTPTLRQRLIEAFAIVLANSSEANVPAKFHMAAVQMKCFWMKGEYCKTIGLIVS